MSIQTHVYGSFSSCLIKNFNETNPKKHKTKQMKWNETTQMHIYTQTLHKSKGHKMNSCEPKQWHIICSWYDLDFSVIFTPFGMGNVLWAFRSSWATSHAEILRESVLVFRCCSLRSMRVNNNWRNWFNFSINVWCGMKDQSISILNY